MKKTICPVCKKVVYKKVIKSPRLVLGEGYKNKTFLLVELCPPFSYRNHEKICGQKEYIDTELVISNSSQ